MAIWFIEDYDEIFIRVNDFHLVPKFRSELVVEEPYLWWYWNDRERGDGGDRRFFKINYLDVADNYSGYVSDPASAQALSDAINVMIRSAFDGGGEILSEKGDLLTNNGATDVVLPVGANRKVLTVDTGQSTFLDWKYVITGITTQTADYTLSLTDGFSKIIIDSASNVDITIPLNADAAFPVGSIIWLYQAGIGKPNVMGDGGVTVTAPDGFNSTRTQYSTIRLMKIAADEWVLAEDLGSSYDDDALIFFDAVEAITTAFSPTEKGYINDFFQALKAEGSLYTKTDFCHLYMGGDLDHMKLNIVNPLDTDAAHRFETVGSPTIDANGVTTNGSSSYVNLNYNPSVSANQDDTARSFYFRSVGAASNFGAMTAGFKGSFLSINQGGCFWSLSNIFETGTTPSPDYNGFWLINRTSSTAADLSRNDSSVDTDTTATDTNINLDEYIGCRNLNGAANNFSADNFCFDWGGNSLTSAEATALYNAVVALQTALGRNV
jgi:hypothetical protein